MLVSNRAEFRYMLTSREPTFLGHLVSLPNLSRISSAEKYAVEPLRFRNIFNLRKEMLWPFCTPFTFLAGLLLPFGKRLSVLEKYDFVEGIAQFTTA